MRSGDVFTVVSLMAILPPVSRLPRGSGAPFAIRNGHFVQQHPRCCPLHDGLPSPRAQARCIHVELVGEPRMAELDNQALSGSRALERSANRVLGSAGITGPPFPRANVA